MNLAKRVSALTPSATLAITAKAKDLKAAGHDVIGLGAGEPDFNTPEHIIEAAVRSMNEGHTKYTPSGGLAALKDSIREKFKRDQGIEYRQSEVIVCTGAKHALYTLFQVLLDEGDEVIIPTPYWVSYPEQVKLAGGKPVFVEGLEENSFKISPEQLEKAVTEKTKAVIINSPSNPTGMMYTEEELKALGEVCLRRNILIVSDEIYEKLIYGGKKHVSIAQLSPELKNQTVIINGVSKSHSMTGWRIGFLFAPKEIAKHILKVHQYNVSCASSISQKAALEAVTNGFDDALIMREQYKKRLDYVYDRLVTMGLDVIKPSGAFYIFPSIKSFGMSSFDFCMSLLEEEGLAIVPGSSFSEYGEGYVRISYAYSPDTLREGLDRLESFVFNKRQSIQTT